jgi:hypothetical protein
VRHALSTSWSKDIAHSTQRRRLQSKSRSHHRKSSIRIRWRKPHLGSHPQQPWRTPYDISLNPAHIVSWHRYINLVTIRFQ